MARAKKAPKPLTRCAVCKQPTPDFDIVNVASVDRKSQQLCNRCFNAEVAEQEGLAGFETYRFEPTRLTDSEGRSHEFHFSTRLFGPGVALDAFELRDGIRAGYEFQIIGDPAEDPMVLLGRLIAKIRRGLSLRHLEHGELGLRIADLTVRAQIDCDLDREPRVPMLIIDGREITWEHFGKMLMNFEGWQFKLDIYDRSEER